MPVWYNPAVAPEKFSNIAITDFSNINSTIEFEELGIKSDDEFYYLFAYANKVTDILFTKGGKEWSYTPQLVKLKIARKDTEKTDWQTKQKVAVPQSTVEKFYCKVIDDLDLECIYSGSLRLQSIPQIEMVVTGSAYGEPLSDEMIKMTILSMCQFLKIEETKHLNLDDLKLPTKTAYSRSSQTEYNKLEDRIKFILANLKLLHPDKQLDTITDLHSLVNNEKESVTIQSSISFIKELI